MGTNKDGESHPAPGPARCTVYIFKRACKVSEPELELPLGDSSPSADLIFQPPQQRTEFESAQRQAKGVEEPGRHTKAGKPSAHTPLALHLLPDPFYLQILRMGRFKLRAVQSTAGRQDLCGTAKLGSGPGSERCPLTRQTGDSPLHH